MSHTYASLAEFHDFRRDSGSQSTANTYNDARIVDILESVSRRIDAWCDRGYGFGPVTATRRYRPDGVECLDLGADLLTLTSATKTNLDGTGSTVLVADTDFYREPLNDTQKRALRALFGTFGSGWLDIVGVWGWQNVTVASSITVSSGLSSGTTATTFTASASGLSAGQSLLIESERVLVSSAVGTAITIVRAQHGSTAATHANASAIAVYDYPSEVKDTCLRLALRRWKARDAGADGLDSGSDFTGVAPREGEDTILRRGVGAFRIWSAG